MRSSYFTCWVMFFFVFIGKITEGRAQTRECLTKDKMVELYQSPMTAVGAYMSGNGWIKDEFNSERNQEFIFHNEKLLFCKMKWKSLMNLKDLFFTLYYYGYERDTICNIIELTASEINCYNNIFNQLTEELKHVPSSFYEEKDENFHFKIYDVKEKYTIVFIEALKEMPSYTVRICNWRQLEHLTSIVKLEKVEKNKKLRYVDDALNRYELLIEREDYDKALSTLDSLWDIVPEYNQKIVDKREYVKILIKEKDIKRKFDECNNYYSNNQLDKAKELCEQVLNLTQQKHTEAIKMLDNIKRKMNIIGGRDTVNYRYRDLQPTAFSFLTKTFNQGINNFVDSTKKGAFKLTLFIDFDTQQQNTSSISVTSDSNAFDKKESFYHTFIGQLQAFNTSLLPTPLFENIAVNVTDTLIMSLLWNSESITVVRKLNKPNMQAKNGFDKFQEIIQSNFDTNPLYTAIGRYTFALKTKHAFDASYKNITVKYTDIALKKFRTVGPEAMVYSLLCPGAGNLASTQGKKGWGSFVSTLIFAGLGSAAILQAEKHYLPIKSYDAKYDNYVKYGAYSSFGIAGVIWTCDIFTALYRGCKNLKTSKQLRQELKKGQQVVVYEPIVVK